MSSGGKGGGGGILGYKYFMGLHMGICRGPVDELVEIRIGGRTAWPIGVGETTPTASNVATLPSNTVYDQIPWTDYEGTPHPSMGAIRLYDSEFTEQFAPGKIVTITGTGRVVQRTYLDDGGSPYVINEHHSADGAYQIAFKENGVWISFNVSNMPSWYFLALPVVSYDSPTITCTVSSDVGVGDTAQGYPADQSKRIYINAPNLFGGNQGEGGIQGPCDVMMGEPTQGVNLDLKAMLGASRLSAFRGVLTLFYDGLIASFNPYPKKWEFRVRRVLKGWLSDSPFYPEKARIDITLGPSLIRSMNGAHIIYECLTNPQWGRGMDPANIDSAAFQAAADTLYAEGFGLCIPWMRQDTIDVFIQTIIDHIGAVMYVSRTTAKVTLKLIRADYDVGTIPSFDRTNGVLSVVEDQSTSTEPLTNEIIVKYVDPRTGEEAQVRAQNIAAIQGAGAIFSDTITYVGVPTAALASRLATRDLRIKGLSLRRMKLSFDRRAFNIEPGSVFKYADASRNIGSIVLRVGKVEDGLNGDSTVVVSCVEDVFGLSATSYLGTPEVIGPPTGGVVPAVYERMFEASYYDMRLLLPAAGIVPNVGYVVASASRATLIHQDFRLYSGTVPETLAERGAASFRAGGKLVANIAFSDLICTIEDVVEPSIISVGMSAMIGDEIVRVDSFNSATNELWISRGCVDTIPANHAAGAVIIFYNRIGAVDSNPYAETEVVYGKMLTRTSAALLNPDLATQHEVEIMGRAGRPYPPGNVKVNDVLYGFPMSFEPGVVVTWAHRNKVVQAETLVSHTEASVTPPAGLTYTIEVYDASDDTLLRTASGITGNTWAYESAHWILDGSVEFIYLKLISVQDGEECWQPYFIYMQINGEGWGKGWGFNWGLVA